jgi:nitroreductase
MNETMKTILSRRSIRAYQDRQITDGELETILEAGKYAASGMNMQTWHFTVVQNKDLLDKLTISARKELLKHDNPMFRERASAPDYSFNYHAPTLIIISGDDSRFALHNCVLALGNMFIAAASLGVGSCWSSVVAAILEGEDGATFRKELKIPEGYKPVAAAGFGYAAGEHPVAGPRKEGIVTILK